MSGLAAAYALRRVGHRVLVLEQRHDFFDVERAGGFRMPPNMSKVFYHWGLETQVRKLAIKSSSVSFRRMESGESLGQHVWDEEVLRETGGDFIFAHHSDLRIFLYNRALDAGARFQANSKVADIDVCSRTVTLESGQTFTADVLIGADGFTGCSRTYLLDGKIENHVRTGMLMYNALIPGEAVRADPELAHFITSDHQVQNVWFGNGTACLVYEIGGNQDLGLHAYAADNGADIEYDVDVEELIEAVQGAESQIVKLAKLAKNISRTPVQESPDMEDWVHDDGPLLLVGDAAHVMPPGSIQSACMGIEDAAVLAKLFSHLLNREQIQSFLYAFQDLRQNRCAGTRMAEMGNVYYMAMQDSDQQRSRDQSFREKAENGLSPISSDSAGTAEAWEGIKEMFGYDAEDEADNWWVEWGILRERAKQTEMDSGLFVQDVRLKR